MPPASVPPDEEERLRSLNDYGILNTPPEKSYDIITRLVIELLGVPIAFLSFVDKDRQWFKSCMGLDVQQTDRNSAFCAHTILTKEPLVVADATLDLRFKDNPLVVGPPFIRFYAGVPLHTSDGSAPGTLCAVSTEPREITEREVKILQDLSMLVVDELNLKLTIRQIRERHQKALQTEKLASIGLLASGIAHEINTPMQFVASNTEFIQSGFEELKGIFEALQRLRVLPSPSGEMLQECEEMQALSKEMDLDYLLREVPLAISQTKEGIARVTEMVNAMKSFMHSVNTGKKWEQLNDAIAVTSTLSRNSWKYNSELKLELANNLPKVFCNVGEINQVVLNLIVNAAQAIEERIQMGWEGIGLILVRTFVDGQGVVIEIEDNGAGIPAKLITKIFDPFFTTKEVGKGTGQGLAISYDIVVNKHKGRFEVHSKPGSRRTVFSVFLPVGSEQ